MPERSAPEGRVAPDRAASDRVGSDRPAPDRAASDSAAPDRPAPDRPAPDRAAPDRAAPPARWTWLAGGAVALFHLAFAGVYGIFRDELYYLACAEHLAWGYVDHPPLIAWITAAVTAVLGESLYALRTLPALAAGGTVVLAARLAAELGGRRWGQALAALAAACVPLLLSLFSFLSMNAFDVVFWTLLAWIAARALAGGDPRLWLAFGAVAGVGLLNKVSVLLLGFGLAAGLVAGRRWDVLRSRWIWLGGALAGLLFLPHLAWQALYGWPTLEFMDNARRFKMVELSAGGFLAEQASMLGPGGVVLALAGVAWLLAGRRARPFRPLGWALLVVVLLLVVQGGKPYYLGAAYPLLLAAGGVAVEAWTGGLRWRHATAVRGTVAVAVVFVGVVAAPLARPVLPVETYVRYAAALGEEPSTDERHALGRLPQFFADRHGWRELAVAVAGVYRSLPPAERERACVFGANYGQAGAIDHFGPELGVPGAISGHNSYWLWGPGECSGETVVVIGGDAGELGQVFASVDRAAVHDCTDCMPYEDDLPIWIARGPRLPLDELWAQVKSYN